mmetsp:Transcript_20155/g.39368  ORF Transcript_20155/g.39368 Transcript_20155/m.39368 type:complete len:81 (+) Transcript_20155:2565-2807(+)
MATSIPAIAKAVLSRLQANGQLTTVALRRLFRSNAPLSKSSSSSSSSSSSGIIILMPVATSLDSPLRIGKQWDRAEMDHE